MATKEILQYYSETENREVRDDLVLAVNLAEHADIAGIKVAIDCGCGAGSDIDFLRAKGFTVHAYDIEKESIKLCQDRFSGDKNVFLSHDSFNSYTYPQSTLIVADSSLFFCSEKEFDEAWNKIFDSLPVGGIFCGSFLGPNDTMAGPDYDKEAYWPNVLVFSEPQLRTRLEKFEVIRFTEHNISGASPQGAPHQWHIYSVVARVAKKNI